MTKLTYLVYSFLVRQAFAFTDDYAVVPLEHIEPAHGFHNYLKEKVPDLQKYKLDVGGEICTDGDKQCKCKECVEGATKWLVEQLIHHADEACNKVSQGEEVDGAVIGMDNVMEMSSPGELVQHDMKKWCKFWTDQREVAIGFFMELMRPWTIAGAWCTGKDICDAPKSSDRFAAIWTQSINVAPGLDMAPGLDNLLNQHHLAYATAVAQNAQDEEEIEDEEEEEKPDQDEDGHVCRKCYRKVTGIVMEKAVEITKGMCEKTKCPAVNSWCKWAGEHKAVAYGMVLAKVEPWKYAIGACWKKDGKKSFEDGHDRLECGCGKHGHHGGHHGRDHGCPCHKKHHGGKDGHGRRDHHGKHHRGRDHPHHRDHDDDDDEHHPHDHDHDHDDDEHHPPMPPQLAILRSVDTANGPLFDNRPCNGTGPCPPQPPVRPVLARLFHAMRWWNGKPHVMEERQHFETPEMEMATPEMVAQEEVYV